MPTYDYECTAKFCGHKFEAFHKMSKNLKKCPKCNGNTLQRLIGSGAGVIFKGKGFYQTDYRSRQYIKDKQYDNRQKRKSERLSNASRTPSDTVHN